mmetsp:Transcript_60237/g.99945  ORF Transcript_60237/g.99945 Transcript_60237/m.99945 type:complete len:105 (-) Transcript_60237:1423-1737(-)
MCALDRLHGICVLLIPTHYAKDIQVNCVMEKWALAARSFSFSRVLLLESNTQSVLSCVLIGHKQENKEVGFMSQRISTKPSSCSSASHSASSVAWSSFSCSIAA